MAKNLSGSSWEKQSNDINYRLGAFGQSRQIAEKLYQTHSNALRIKRDGYKDDFISYLKDLNVDESKKLNTYFSTKNISDFLEKRIQNLSRKTSENYIRGFGSMMKGLEANHINVKIDYSKLDDIVIYIKENIPKDIENLNKAVYLPSETIKALHSKNEAVALVSEIQYHLGFRISESRDLLQNPQKYVKDNKVENLTGKGNHIYKAKEIIQSLVFKIMNFIGNVPSVSYINKCIKETEGNENKSSHGFRYAYVKKLKELGYSNRYISKEINHHRESITRYYLQRC